MIDFDRYKEYSEEINANIQICSECRYLGFNDECLVHECRCFATSVVINNLGCPLNKW